MVLAEAERIQLSLASPPVFFPVPCYGDVFASTALAPGLRLSLAPSPSSYRVGFEPLSEASSLRPAAAGAFFPDCPR